MNQRRAREIGVNQKVFDRGFFGVIWRLWFFLAQLRILFEGSSLGFSTLEFWVVMVTRFKIRYSLCSGLLLRLHCGLCGKPFLRFMAWLLGEIELVMDI